MVLDTENNRRSAHDSERNPKFVTNFLLIPLPHSLFPNKPPCMAAQMADHRVPFSKACRSLHRRRFKEIEDAPFAVYDLNQPGSKSPETFSTVRSLFT
jgi:hypothetical protein